MSEELIATGRNGSVYRTSRPFFQHKMPPRYILKQGDSILEFRSIYNALLALWAGNGYAEDILSASFDRVSELSVTPLGVIVYTNDGMELLFTKTGVLLDNSSGEVLGDASG